MQSRGLTLLTSAMLTFTFTFALLLLHFTLRLLLLCCTVLFFTVPIRKRILEPCGLPREGRPLAFRRVTVDRWPSDELPSPRAEIRESEIREPIFGNRSPSLVVRDLEPPLCLLYLTLLLGPLKKSNKRKKQPNVRATELPNYRTTELPLVARRSGSAGSCYVYFASFSYLLDFPTFPYLHTCS